MNGSAWRRRAALLGWCISVAVSFQIGVIVGLFPAAGLYVSVGLGGALAGSMIIAGIATWAHRSHPVDFHADPPPMDHDPDLEDTFLQILPEEYR